jgi:hypothetical protein
MGLDMYLYARKYVSRFDYKDRERVETPEFTALAATGPEGLTKYGDYSGIEIEYPVMYWRKANAIHGWFVNECGGGVDECQRIYVSRESLVKLRDLCQSVLLQPAMAGDILPPTPGFFFGTYEIDDWYMEDMKHTVDALTHILATVPADEWDWSFVYRASW